MTELQGWKRILVATDFSSPAASALNQAIWLAHNTNASVTLAHVLPKLRSEIQSPAGPKMEMLLDLLGNEDESREALELASIEEANAKMRQLLERSGEPSLGQSMVCIGESFVEITRAVQKEAYDLVLAGTRGLSQWKEFLVGSTAKRLIRKCPSSVWIVKAEHVAPPKVVLAAIDFSDVSVKVVEQGLWVAQQADAEFHVLHVVDSKDVPDDLISRIPKGSSLKKEIHAEASKHLSDFLDSLPVDRTRIQTHLAWGTPWQELRRLATHLAADLIVMGTVGRSGIYGLLLGNTAEKILDTCDCSILTVKPKDFVSPIVSQADP